MESISEVKRMKEGLSYLQFINSTDRDQHKLTLKFLLISIFFLSVFKISKGILT